MAQRKRKTPSAPHETDERIVDAAIALGEETGWRNLRLRLVAERLGLNMAEIHGHFRDADAIADAWFARAEAAIVLPRGRAFARLPARARLHSVMLGWFDALSEHRRITAEMLRVKLYAAHPHHWLPMVFNLSRLIQWLRDAAGLDGGGRRRRIEEIGLSALFLATLAVWVRDETPGQERTRRFLERRLRGADRLMARLFPGIRA